MTNWSPYEHHKLPLRNPNSSLLPRSGCFRPCQQRRFLYLSGNGAHPVHHQIPEHGLPIRFDLLDIPIILVEARCSYKSQALFGEMLTVGVGVTRFGNKSFDLNYKIVGEDGRLVAIGKTVQVMYDYDNNSAFPIPDVIKQSVYAFQSGWSTSEIL